MSVGAGGGVAEGPHEEHGGDGEEGPRKDGDEEFRVAGTRRRRGRKERRGRRRRRRRRKGMEGERARLGGVREDGGREGGREGKGALSGWGAQVPLVVAAERRWRGGE